MGKNKNPNKIIVNQPHNMSAAVAAVKSGELPLRKAAHLYHVSTLTLRKHLRGGPVVKSNPFLTQEEEKELVEWTMASKKNGFSFRQLKFLQSVHKIIRDNNRLGLFKTGLPGRDWRKRFRKTHPEVDEEASHEGCGSLIADMPPSRLFITDLARLQYVEADGEQKEKRASAMIAFSATGSTVPPIIVYPYEDNIPEEVKVTVRDGWGSSHSGNGKMTNEDYYDYFVNVFNRYLEEHKIEKPVVVFADNYSSRVTLQFSKMCKEKEIIVAVHPDSKNVSPSNKKSFRPLKAGWSLAVDEYLRQNSGTQISSLLLAPLLKNAIERHLDANTLIEGFKSTGWYPQNQTDEESGVESQPSLIGGKIESESWMMVFSDDGSCDSD